MLVSPNLKADEVLRIGMIGCDTSHVPAFAKLLNHKDAEGVLAEVKVDAVKTATATAVAVKCIFLSCASHSDC